MNNCILNKYCVPHLPSAPHICTTYFTQVGVGGGVGTMVGRALGDKVGPGVGAEVDGE
jgi:hypothetical protein